MTRLLTRDQIMQAPDRCTEVVAVPEWGGDVRVRNLTARERDELEASVYQGEGRERRANMRNLRARLVALACVDEQGARLFSDDDVALLGEKSAAAVDRIFGVAQRLAGLSTKDVEDLAGNSAPGPSAGSSSG